MRLNDSLRLVIGTLRAQPLRAGLTVLGIAVGIAAVVLLTAIGAGVQHYVIREFTQFGTNIIAVAPGRKSTLGVAIGAFGIVRPLSLDDSEALRQVPQVLGVAPVIRGNARVEAEAGRRNRRTEILGIGPEAPIVWNLTVAAGRSLPPDDPRAARPLAILGATLRQELFGSTNPLGQIVRIGQHRFRIIGVLGEKGQVLDFDMDNALYVPAARALELFNREGLMEINIRYAQDAPVARVMANLRRVLIERHGREDFTLTDQDQMLAVLNRILGVLTAAVAALGSLSLLVGGVGILTIMTIAVSERTAEIGLLRALGGSRRQILGLFLGEAVVLAGIGGLTGLALGGGLAWLLAILLPALPVRVSLFYVLLALGLSAAIGLLAGVLPARHAARLDPVEALRAE